jgi:hypothetical protein
MNEPTKTTPPAPSAASPAGRLKDDGGTGLDEIFAFLEQLDERPVEKPARDDEAVPETGECPECEHCTQRRWAGEQTEYHIGDFCASRRGKHGREYFQVTGFSDEGYVLGTIEGVGLSEREGRWHRQLYDRQVGRQTACLPGGIERRFTPEQWVALREAGWPLSIVGTLRKARVPVEPPARSPDLGGSEDVTVTDTEQTR